MNESAYIVAPLAEQSVVVTMDYLLAAAIRQHASDIHIQFQDHDAVVRFRIDGVLVFFTYLSQLQALRMFSRLKVLMGLDVTQLHQPQDGGLRLHIEEKQVDIRASFFPSLQGEKAVIRLLDGYCGMTELHTLPFAPALLRALYRTARRDQGLFLVTGPTGAGKTTTLYALLQAVDRTTRNVVTLENPIEYRIDQVTQTQIDTNHSLTFAQAVRSLLRQDPDVALIGELRDGDTVHSAVEAALTGHLVFSSLHTGSASGVPIRLREMGIEPYLIAHALKGVLAQRLLHLLCSACKTTVAVDASQKAWAAGHGVVMAVAGYAPGCAACHYTGVGGQRVIAELWECDKGMIVDLLQNTSSTQADFEAAAQKNGMIPLARVGLQLAQEQLVSLEELMSRDL